LNRKGFEQRGRGKHSSGAYGIAPERLVNVSIIECSSVKTLLNSVRVGPVGCGSSPPSTSCLARRGSGGIATGMIRDLLFVSLWRTAG